MLALWLPRHAHGAGRAGGDREDAAESAEGGPNLQRWPPAVESADGRHGIELSGRLHLDTRLDPTGRNFESGPVVRRARIGFRAFAFDRIRADLAVQYALGSMSFENAFLEVDLHDRVRLRAGQMLRPFSLQRGVPSNALVHPERAVAVETLAQFRDVGVMLEADVIDALELQLGVFEGTNALEFDNPPDVAARARSEPRSGLLFDLGYRWSPPSARGSLPSDARTAGNRLAPVLIYDRDAAWREGSRHALATGARVVVGPVMMHGEFLLERTERVRIRGQRVGDLHHLGGVFDLSWAITGEHQHDEALEPSRPLRPGGAAGAWQLAVRYQVVRTDRDTLATGVAEGARVMHGAAGSLVWTPVPHLRWMVSYDYARLQGVVGAGFGRNVHAVMMRLDFRF